MSRDQWISVIERLHSLSMAENMAAMTGLLLEDETKLNAIQSHLIRSLCSFIAAVYDQAYVNDHFDIHIYADKAMKLSKLEMKRGPIDENDHTFTLLNDTEERKLMLQLPKQLGGFTTLDGISQGLTLKLANELIDAMETPEFKQLLIKIIKSKEH